ncbi:DNA sulfur modification protein DndD [Citrifermentans bremense]|uniref:DNA sulfur modification protein DndD n=1 Tax=Citrifermentans bremense TaxID=60035 RepID=UPI000411AB4A|nr:DNA sulfur modification protein DndD [Citrifermentans bremense]
MIFNKLTLVNVGNFAGTHVFNLRQKETTAEPQPIVLFGGLNGAGKTTIFDAIKLCLYGQEMFGAIPVARYHDYLRKKIHASKTTDLQPTFASIALAFDYTQQGQACAYRVERFWENREHKLHESLKVSRNGKTIAEVERDSWQDFIKEIIPIGLSQLFFFDGEKIQKMMSEDSSEQLRKSIFALLGLDLVERLQADLKIYRSKHLQETQHENYRNDLDELEGQLRDVDAEIKMINDNKASLQNAIDQLTDQIATYRDKVAAQGEGYYRNRLSQEDVRRKLEYEIDAIRDRFRELAAGLLPVAVAASVALKLKAQVETERSQKAATLLAASLALKYQELLTRIDAPDFLVGISMQTVALNGLKEAVKAELSRLFSRDDRTEPSLEVFGYSGKQTIDVLHAIDAALNNLPEEMAALSVRYESGYRQLQETIAFLNKVPDEELIQPMYEQLASLNMQMGGLTEKRNTMDAQLGELANRRNEIERWVVQLERKLGAAYDLEERLQTVFKVERVLADYHRQLARQKVFTVQNEFTTIFRMLHRKEDMIASVRIDPDTFGVRLFDRQGAEISIGSLSSGELEIYAMSMLWALAKTSGQKLPFIVDTPLARLDSKHRDNLVELFFPYASHQMMIFSTNTEVDQQYFEQLEPSIAQAYNLEYCEERKSTVAKEGYFWN